MKTTKIAANIKASVLRLAVTNQWCERTSWCSRQRPATPIARIVRVVWCL